MARAANTALYCAEEFDKCIMRQVHRFGGTYETIMTEHVHEFFSDDFWHMHFELRFKFRDMEYSFMGYNDKGKIMDMTSNEAFGLYGNAHALKSMLRDRTFSSMNKWGAACQNAVGGNIGSMPLARRLFAAGQCYEDLVLGAKAAREAAGAEVSELSAPEDDDSGSEREPSDSEGSSQQRPRFSTPAMPRVPHPATSGAE